MNEYKDNTGRNVAIAAASAVVIILLLITVFSAIRYVGTGEVGVVTNYGKVTGRELSEGQSWVAPWGVDAVTKYDVKTQKEEQQAASATRDLQDVNATVVLNYRLERGQVSNMHKTVGTGYKDVLISPAVQETFKATTAKYNALELQTNRDKVKGDVLAGLQKRLNPRGIVIEDVSITNLQYSPEFTKAIEQRQVAQQQAERARYTLERAKLDAQSQDVQAKTLTDEYLRLKAIEKWNGKMPQAVGSNSFLNIPLK